MTITYKNESFDISVEGNDITLQGLHSDIILVHAYPGFLKEAHQDRDECLRTEGWALPFDDTIHEYERQNLEDYVERILKNPKTEIKVINHSIN